LSWEVVSVLRVIDTVIKGEGIAEENDIVRALARRRR